MSEADLHRAVAVYLTVMLGSNTPWTTIAHGTVKLTPREGRRLKDCGMKPGWPDIVLVHDGRCYWIELKAKRGSLSPAQLVTNEALMRAGCAPHLCRSIDDVRASLKLWRIPTRERPEARAA